MFGLNKKEDALKDQRGNVSSKRLWANRFGWATVWQVVLLNGAAIFFTVVGKDMPSLVFEIAKYSITSTLTGCLVLLGISIGEWWAPLQGRKPPESNTSESVSDGQEKK